MAPLLVDCSTATRSSPTTTTSKRPASSNLQPSSFLRSPSATESCKSDNRSCSMSPRFHGIMMIDKKDKKPTTSSRHHPTRKDSTDSSSTSSSTTSCYSRSLAVIIEVQVRFADSWEKDENLLEEYYQVMSRHDYTTKEKRMSWYTPQELQFLERDALQTARRLQPSSHCSSHNCNNRTFTTSNSSSYYHNYPSTPFNTKLRGLEFLTNAGYRRIKNVRMVAVDAVLREQFNQQLQFQCCLQQDIGLLPDQQEKLRLAYQTFGWTLEAQQVAYVIAARDREEALLAASADSGSMIMNENCFGRGCLFWNCHTYPQEVTQRDDSAFLVTNIVYQNDDESKNKTKNTNNDWWKAIGGPLQAILQTILTPSL